MSQQYKTITRPANLPIHQAATDQRGNFWSANLLKMQVPVSSVRFYQGSEAKKIHRKLCDKLFYRQKVLPLCIGLFIEQGLFLAFDNREGLLWTEEFSDRMAALDWLGVEPGAD